MKYLYIGAIMLIIAVILAWVYYGFVMAIILVLAIQGNEIVQRANDKINKHIDL
jgi:hypothetical protein